MYTLHHGHCVDVLAAMPADSVQCCVTSPPYWGLRNYQAPGQIGLEETLDAHLQALVEVFREVRRVLHPRGVLWVNYGSMYANDGGCGTGGGYARANRSYQQRNERAGVPAGYKPKDLILADALLALDLQRDGWWLRSEVIWHKPTAMPESAADRPMRDHEKLFLFAKSEYYHYDKGAVMMPVTGRAHARGKGLGQKAIRFPANWAKGEGSHRPHEHLRNGRQNVSYLGTITKTVTQRQRRTVWTVCAEPFKGAHFATFPTKLVEPCILAGSKPGDVILDPLCGAGTTGLVALRHGRRFVGIDVNEAYLAMTRDRIERERWMWDRKEAHGD